MSETADATVASTEARVPLKDTEEPSRKLESAAEKSDAPSDANSGVEPAPPSDEQPSSPSLFSGWGFGALLGAATSPRLGSTNGPDLTRAAAEMASAAGSELGQASRAAKEGLGKAAEEIGKGWGTLNTFLDDILSPGTESETRAAPETEADINSRFHKLFPDVDASEEVVDRYACTLVQKYRCYLNSATPEKTFPLRGVLYVGTATLGMHIEDDGGAFGGEIDRVVVKFGDVIKIQKGQKSMLRIVAQGGVSYVFAGFESDTHFSGALALLEHMAGAAGKDPPAPPPPTPAQQGQGKTEPAAQSAQTTE